MEKKTIIAGVLLALVAFTAFAYAESVEGTKEGKAFGHFGKFGPLSQLTGEQHAALKEQINALREQGADWEEIMEAKKQFFAANGIEWDLEGMGFHGMGGHGFKRFGKGFGHGPIGERFNNLTEEQKTALKALHEEFRQRMQEIVGGK